MLDHRKKACIFTHDFDLIASVDNLLAAWSEFVAGKRSKPDVQEFSHHLMDNLLALRADLLNGTYQHGDYFAFKISDPKPRDIHKASVRDRLVHHAIYRQLYPFFDSTWVADSYSCRDNKGTHRAMNRFRKFGYQVSKNHTRTCWVLKCDVRKFFASIDQAKLLEIASRYVQDQKTTALIRNIVSSFHSTAPGKGLPLGNLTSQLLVNVYMNEFDQFAKHKLKGTHYIRYADDFVFMSHDRQWLEDLIPKIAGFLGGQLSLKLHPDKVYIKTLASGVDFLGWIHFKDHRVIRTASKHRMFRNLAKERTEPRTQSYRGMLSHGNAHRLSTKHLFTS